MVFEEYPELSWRGDYELPGSLDLRFVDVFDLKLPIHGQTGQEHLPLGQWCIGKDALPKGLVAGIVYNNQTSYLLPDLCHDNYGEVNDPAASIISSLEDDARSYSTEDHSYSMSPMRSSFPSFSAAGHGYQIQIDQLQPQNIDPMLVYMETLDHPYQYQTQNDFQASFRPRDEQGSFGDNFESKDLLQRQFTINQASMACYVSEEEYQDMEAVVHDEATAASESNCTSSHESNPQYTTLETSTKQKSPRKVITGKTRYERRRDSISSDDSSSPNGTPPPRSRATKKTKTQHVCPQCPDQYFRNKSELRYVNSVMMIDNSF